MSSKVGDMSLKGGDMSCKLVLDGVEMSLGSVDKVTSMLLGLGSQIGDSL